MAYMIVSRAARTLEYLALAVLVPLAMCGCGGSPGSSDTSNGVAPTTKSPGSLTRSVKLNSYNSWMMIDPIYKRDPDKLQTALRTMAQHDIVLLPEQEWVNLTPGWDKLSVASLRNLNPNIRVYGYYRCAKSSIEADWGKEQDQVPENPGLDCPIPYHEIRNNNWWLRDGNGNIVASGSSDGKVIYHYLEKMVVMEYCYCLKM